MTKPTLNIEIYQLTERTKRAPKAPKPWPTLGASSINEALSKGNLSNDKLSRERAMVMLDTYQYFTDK